MAALGWKRFRFFNEFRRTDLSIPSDVICTCCALDGTTWLGCVDGMAIAVDQSLSLLSAFRSHEGPIITVACSQV